MSHKPHEFKPSDLIDWCSHGVVIKNGILDESDACCEGIDHPIHRVIGLHKFEQQDNEFGVLPQPGCAACGAEEFSLIHGHKSTLPDGIPCEHPCCLSHISHPCEGCGRIGGRSQPRKYHDFVDSGQRYGKYHARICRICGGSEFNPEHHPAVTEPQPNSYSGSERRFYSDYGTAIEYLKSHTEGESRAFVEVLSYKCETMFTLILELADTLKGAREELRLIRDKDTNAVYDPTLRVRIDISLAKVGE